MSRIGWLVAAAALAAPPSEPNSRDSAVRYVVTLDPATPCWHVSASFPHAGGPFEAWWQRWTAGAYHLADYGANVAEVSARAANGVALELERDGVSRLAIADAPPGTLTIDYTAVPCAQRDVNDRMVLSVEGNRIAADYAYVSPNSLLCFSRPLIDAPCEVRYELPPGWRTACALDAGEDGTLLAPSWWRLEDSPALFSPTLDTAEFTVDGIAHAVSLHGGPPDRAELLAERCRRIVEAARDWMQGLPYPRYHFLLASSPSESGGAGLEHANSTLIVTSPALLDTPDYDHLLAHEYFHAWCAERIHVAALDRPDFTVPLRTGTIWVNEGITEYFCRHLLVSAGLRDRRQFFAELAEEGRMARMLARMTGEQSWTEVSRATPDWDDMSDLMTFSAKHYPGGCVTMLALDLEMRAASGGERGIADLLRYLMHAHANRGIGFGEEEMPAIVAGIAQADLDPFFARYVDGPELPALKEALQVIGYTVKGGMREIVALPEPTPAQRSALEDFFTPPPAHPAPPPR